MRKLFTYIYILAAMVVAIVPCLVQAAELDFVGPRISTLGAGAEFGIKLNPHVTVRGIGNGFDFNYNRTVDSIAYDGKLKLASYGAQVDYRFMENGPLYVTAGLYANKNKVHATATPTQPTKIGDLVFTPSQIGTLTSDAKFKDSAPYLGIGARWPVGHVEFNLEAGAYFQGKPKVTLTSDGSLASNSAYQAELAKEQQSEQNDLNDFGTYPVVALGLRYKF
jgi:hypothetical protein